MSQNIFKKTLNFGNRYEDIVLANLYSRFNYLYIEDVSKSSYHQKKGIDAYISKDSINYYSVEIKADRLINQTGNILIEERMKRVFGDKEGWFHYCEAEYILYVDTVTSVCHVINWHLLRKDILVGNHRLLEKYNSVDNCMANYYLIRLADNVEKEWYIGGFKLNKNINTNIPLKKIV